MSKVKTLTSWMDQETGRTSVGEIAKKLAKQDRQAGCPRRFFAFPGGIFSGEPAAPRQAFALNRLPIDQPSAGTDLRIFED
jgi:hypothetical protein